jgi:hypothetical protein
VMMLRLRVWILGNIPKLPITNLFSWGLSFFSENFSILTENLILGQSPGYHFDSLRGVFIQYSWLSGLPVGKRVHLFLG